MIELSKFNEQIKEKPSVACGGLDWFTEGWICPAKSREELIYASQGFQLISLGRMDFCPVNMWSVKYLLDSACHHIHDIIFMLDVKISSTRIDIMLPITVALYVQSYCSPITINASFKNDSPNRCYEIATTSLMSNNRPHGNLRITDKQTGEKAVYTGPMIKAKPSYVSIQPGETKVVDVNIGEQYNMVKGSQYNVRYLSSLTYRDCSDHSAYYHDFIESNTIEVVV